VEEEEVEGEEEDEVTEDERRKGRAAPIVNLFRTILFLNITKKRIY